jgi:hypothetical protein
MATALAATVEVLVFAFASAEASTKVVTKITAYARQRIAGCGITGVMAAQ